MRVCIYEDVLDLGRHAAAVGAARIRQTLVDKGECAIILATGASQFAMLDALVAEPGIDWQRVEVFHLDEYVGLTATHPASFRKYLRERFAERVPVLRAFHYIEADSSDLQAEIGRLSGLIAKRTIAVAFIGIGENGHLAFNDPPADLDTVAPYLVVQLDEACRRQQVGEGWFNGLSDVPTHAVSMSINQILSSSCIVCTVPDERKAAAVQMAMTAPMDALHPCAALRGHADCYLMLDRAAASSICAGC
jgi:glucosamine-6-phosphate deaminase